MTRIAADSVNLQTTSESTFSTPSCFGEVVVISSSLQKHGVLSKINEHGRVARKRCGQDEVMNILAVLFGDAISGERILEEFYERLQPFAVPFIAPFEQDSCLLVQPSRAFWQRSPRLLLKRFARFFSMICSLAHSPRQANRRTAGSSRERLDGC